MLTRVVQRWRDRRDSYRPKGEPIDPCRYEVASIAGDSSARAFVERHHYSCSYPAARERIGLYRGTELVGIAVFSVPMQGRVLDVLPCPRAEAVELGRLVLLDNVPANGESWFIARAFEHLRRRGYAGVVSFADPVPRRTLAGAVVFPGHLGTIYQASNAVYAGRASPGVLRLLPTGAVLSKRAISKIRARDKGWVYAVDQLVTAGAGAPDDTTVAGLRSWLERELPRVTRPLRHAGNHRYLFGLTPGVRRRLPASLPYPKLSPRPREAP